MDGSRPRCRLSILRAGRHQIRAPLCLRSTAQSREAPILQSLISRPEDSHEKAVTVFGGYAVDLADDITYRHHIKPLLEQKSAGCHGADSPYYGEFEQDKARYKALMKGPRMDTYADLIFFIGWPDTGAVMRRLDDGANTEDGKPGNMYQYLGATRSERKANFVLLKSWVGDAAWRLNRWKSRGDAPAITKAQLDQLKIKY